MINQASKTKIPPILRSTITPQRHYLFFLFCLIFSIISLPVYAQLDSLEQRLSSLSDNEERIDLLNELSYAYHRKDIQKTFDYANEALALAKTLGYGKGKAFAMHYLSIANTIAGDANLSKTLNAKAIHLADSLQAFDLLISTYNVRAFNLTKSGEPAKAIEAFQFALDIAQRENDKKGYSSIALNLGEVHANNKNFKKARFYYQEARTAAKEIGEIIRTAWADRLVAETYLEEKNYEEAITFFEKSIKGATIGQDTRSIAIAKTRLAKAYLETGKFKSAQQQAIESLELMGKVGDKEGLAEGHMVLSATYIKGNQASKAIVAAKQAIELLEQVDNIQLKIKAQDLLVQAYGSAQNFKKAYELNVLTQALKDSLDYRNRMNLATELEEKYQSEKKESENILLRSEQLYQKEIIEQQKSINLILIALAILLALLGYMALHAYRNKKRNNLLLEEKVKERTTELQKSNTELVQSNKELARFAYVASHDLREPLRNITNFSQLLQLKLKGKEDREMEEFVNIIHKNTIHMNRLIVDTLEFTRLTNSETNNQKVDLNETIKNIKSTITNTLVKKNAQIELLSPLPIIVTNESLLFSVFKNLIENGINYNEHQAPLIQINHTEKGGFYRFSVTDNGIGISEKYHKTIFEMFKRLQNRDKYEGSGMGLANCKKIISKLGGDIWVESDGANGATFIFTIPKAKINPFKNLSGKIAEKEEVVLS